MTIPGLFLALQMIESNDEQLAVRLQRRDPAALADLYDRFGRTAWSVVAAIVADNAVAEDLVVESFLLVWNRMHLFEPAREALGPWLLAIARNRAIEHVHASRSGAETDVREHPSLFLDAEREVLNADHARIIRRAIAGLDENRQKVIELAYYEGLSQPEMAAKMGEPFPSVQNWVRSALKHLREQLGQAVSS